MSLQETKVYYLRNIDYSDRDVKIVERKGDKTMFGIEISFYAIGFLTCLFLIAIIVEVNDKDRKNKRELRRMKRELEKQVLIVTNRCDTEIDIKI